MKEQAHDRLPADMLRRVMRTVHLHAGLSQAGNVTSHLKDAQESCHKAYQWDNTRPSHARVENGAVLGLFSLGWRGSVVFRAVRNGFWRLLWWSVPAFWEPTHDGAKHTVDELAGTRSTVVLGDLDRLVDRRLLRDVVFVQQFVDGDTQDIAVDGGELIHRKGGSRLADYGVDLGEMRDHAGRQALRVDGDLRQDGLVLIGHHPFEDLIERMGGDVAFEEILHREHARLMTCALPFDSHAGPVAAGHGVRAGSFLSVLAPA